MPGFGRRDVVERRHRKQRRGAVATRPTGTGLNIRSLSLLVGAMTLWTAAAAEAQAPDREGTVAAGAPFAWSGDARSGISGHTTLAPYPADPGACSLPHERCDRTLLRVEGEPDQLRIEVVIDPSDLPSPFGHDLDLYVYASDASGALGERVGESENGDSDPEAVVLARPRGWYVVHVVWSFAMETGFDATAVIPTPRHAPPLPVDLPAAAVLEVRPATLRTFGRRGLRARVRCSAECDAVVSFLADRRSVRRLRLRRPRIALARTNLRQAGAADITLRPPSDIRGRLRRARMVTGTVRAVIRGPAGGEHVLTERVAVRG